MYHYFYKITNNINGHFYYGVHNTDNLDDGYMGSGKRLHYAYKKYGIENFTKEILKYFDTMDEAYLYEHEIVNEEMVNNHDCYNILIGGRYFNTSNMVPVKDKLGNKFWINRNDEAYINKEVLPIWSGKHHKEESKLKTRKKMTPSNSTNPRIWINKNGAVKYLRKELLNEYINNGWNLGRVNYKPQKNVLGAYIIDSDGNYIKREKHKKQKKSKLKSIENTPDYLTIPKNIILDLIELHYSKNLICKKLNISNYKLNNILKYYNLYIEKPILPLKDYTYEQYISEINSGMSKEAIGRKYGVSSNAINHKIARILKNNPNINIIL